MDIWGETHIDFLGKRRIMFLISGLLCLLGLIAALAIPFGRANLGTDFEGGIAIQFRFERPPALDAARSALAASGFAEASIQSLAGGNKLLVRLKRSDTDLRSTSRAIGEAFSKAAPDNPFTVDSTTEVGPTVGRQLQRDALWAIGISMLVILIYVAWRLEFRFGVAAVAATFHDVLVVMGLLFVLNKEINLLIITALLTLAGYSLTDTVVVFDRIRENMARRGKEEFIPLVNRSINEVLRRTLVTSITTLLALVALLFIGGEVIHDFSFTLFVGILIGTYSSIFIASPVLLFWKDAKGHVKRPNA